MILPRNVILCVHKNMCRYRLISMTSIKGRENERKNLPSRQLFVELTEKAYIHEKLSRSGRKAFESMIEKPIIVKNFFISELESEEIEYPSLMSMQQLDEQNTINSTIAQYLTKYIHQNDVGNQLCSLKKFNVFGYDIPKEFGGKEYRNTELSFALEFESQNVAIAMALNSHRLFSSAISGHGTTEQCKQYLPKLASGEWIGTVAIQDWKNVTRADYDEDDECWYLDGTKSFVINSSNANMFLVLAQTQTHDRQGDKKNSLTFFIVDGSLPGVEIHPKDETIGFMDSYQSKVSFKDVKLTKDAVLSIPGTGSYIEDRMNMKLRLSQGIVNLAQMKTILKFMQNIVESIEKTSVEQNNEAVTLRLAIGKYTCSIYALESILYLTTGIMDKYDNTNIDLETGIFKTYAQEQLWNMAVELLAFLDTRVTLSEHPLNYLIRNAIQLKFTEPINELKLHIARECIQYRLRRLIEERHNKDFIMKNFLPVEKIDMYPCEMQDAAKNLFESITLLRLCASTLIHLESKDTPAQDSELINLTDSVSCIYTSYACLLRGNQAIKLRVPYAEQETSIARMVCNRNFTEVKRLTQYIEDGPTKTFEKFHVHIANLLLQKPPINFPAHPLTRFE